MSLSNKLETWRKDLIDMSRRNPLLYYKTEGRGAGIQFLPDSPSNLFAELYGRHGSITLDRENELCALEWEDLHRRLLRLRARVREDENDRGTRTLYMVFGMLEWYETAFSQEVIRSPLIFVPVNLTYKTAADSFSLKFIDDLDSEINPTLREKLNHDFKIVLPTFGDLLSGANAGQRQFESLLESIKEIFPQDNRWTIAPEVHLGRFAFQKLVMYQDLQRNLADVLAHPLLQVLGGDTSRPALPSWLPSPEQFDDIIPPQRTLEILDADSSQQEAILLAKADVSFVLKGPPGTGKSQTIANIIAETLGQGKHVLFVSEKMAALDVVRKRLQGAGLGDFCLDLHNPRTNATQKAEFMNALKTSLDEAMMPPQSASDASWQRESSNLQWRRNELNAYERELHLNRAPLGKSAFDAYAQLAQLADVPDLDFNIPGVNTVTMGQFDAIVRAVEKLGECRDVLDAYDTYPWRETRATHYTFALDADIRAHFTKLSGSLRTLQASLAQMLDLLGENAAVNFAWMPYAVERAEAVLKSPQPLRSWLTREAAARLRPQAADMAVRSKAYTEQVLQFERVYSRSLLSEDLATLQQPLTGDSDWAIGCVRSLIGSPHDTAIALRADLEKHLVVGSQALASITPAATTLADLCGAEQPESLGETSAMIAISRHLLQTPTPPSAWLNPATYAVTRAMAGEAQSRYAHCKQMRDTLESIYQPTFFALDMHGLAERFSTQYRSFFRFLQTSYHRDVKLVRSLLLPGQVRTVAQIETDIYQAVKLHDIEKALAEKQIEYAQTLDRYFDGAKTDWEKLAASLRWVTELHNLLNGVPLAPVTAALIVGPAKALRPVSAALDRLAEVYTQWEQVETFCMTTLHVSPLLQDSSSFDDVAPGQAQAVIDKLLGDLQTFWQAIDTIQRHRHLASEPNQPIQWTRLCADVELAQHIYDFETRLTEKSERFTEDFGRFFRGTDTDWQRIVTTLAWTEGFLTLYRDRGAPEPTMALVAYPGDASRRNALQQALASLQQTMPQMNVELMFSDTKLPRAALNETGKTFETSALSALADRVDFLVQQLPALEKWLTCQERLNICRQAGLSSFIESLLGHHPIPQNIDAIFQRRFYKLWLDGVRSQSPTLARFRGAEHSNAVEQFRSLDKNHKMLARKRLQTVLKQHRRQVFSGSENAPGSDLARAIVALRRETQKKRRSAIRVTVRKTAPALLELKPCWMMSPLSVSQFLESGNQLFDLVIFDEASQVCPEDSITSILRGKQLIVVGDPKQLPPPRFFAKSLADNIGAEEDDEEEGKEERTQSILDECIGSDFDSRSLQWHYRSADESLIAFSNYHFYGDQLVTFPSAFGDREQGVHFEYVEDGVYGFGGTRKNRKEAERVADIVFEYLQRHKDRSLGIVALSAAQQEAISEALDSRTKRNPNLQVYTDALYDDDPDGIFIKNLESVQGDERDTIILSVGYGPDANRKVHFNFGPVNNANGERRLNVAVTRARKQMIVVSSMKAVDLPLTIASKGARVLRSYLAYAEACSDGGALRGKQTLAEQATGGAPTAAALAEEPQFESPFEEAVYNALIAHGLTLDTQVGCSGYRIDLAVRDPEHPGSYLLGIECDGASYHSSKTARDRDRLRQAQLETMGWTLHRIWSSDWFAKSDNETRKVLDALSSVVISRPGATHPEVKNARGLTRYSPTEDELPPNGASTTLVD
jgi:very-short-patch-repair endonuclease